MPNRPTLSSLAIEEILSAETDVTKLTKAILPYWEGEVTDLSKLIFDCLGKVKQPLIVDIDGILVEESNIPLENKKINWDVIAELKRLSSQYEIILYTSRIGRYSFWETVDFIESVGLREYVKEIIFNKRKAAYYVDDKALTNLEGVL